MKILILFPVGILIILYVWIGQIIPLHKERGEISAQNSIYEQEIVIQETKIREITTFINGVKNSPEEAAFLNSYVPSTPAEQDVINFFSRSAGSRNIQIYNMSFGEPVSGENKDALSSTTVEVQVAGTYADLFDFMRDVFFIERLYTAETIIAEKVDDEERASDFLTLSATFVYYFADGDLTLSSEQAFSKLSFDRIGQFASGLFDVPSIDQIDNPGRRNLFLP